LEVGFIGVSSLSSIPIWGFDGGKGQEDAGGMKGRVSAVSGRSKNERQERIRQRRGQVQIMQREMESTNSEKTPASEGGHHNGRRVEDANREIGIAIRLAE
jgi:hypothetical protein